MLSSMDTFTIIIFLAVTVVLAVAIIALAIWVAVLSGRMKKAIDTKYTEVGRSESSSATNSSQELTIPTGPGRVLNPPMSQANNAYAQNNMRQQVPNRRVAPQGYDGYGASMRTLQPSGPMAMDEPDYGNNRGDSAFFENYQEQDYASQNGFGRRKPTIPFGKAKEGPARRYDSYTESALDSDYDPDSIDFSRVEGYKNFRR